MKFINSTLLVLSSLFAATPDLQIEQKSYASQSELSPWQEVVKYARQNLSQEGYLTMKPDGYVYLKVEDDYIHALFPLLGLQKKGFAKPPYFRSKKAIGAHISVIYQDEKVVPYEIGQKFQFKEKRIAMVQPNKGERYVVLQVESPQLENLRKRYGLSPKLHGHEFHITLAKKDLKRAQR